MTADNQFIYGGGLRDTPTQDYPSKAIETRCCRFQVYMDHVKTYSLNDLGLHIHAFSPRMVHLSPISFNPPLVPTCSTTLPVKSYCHIYPFFVFRASQRQWPLIADTYPNPWHAHCELQLTYFRYPYAHWHADPGDQVNLFESSPSTLSEIRI